VIVLTNSIIQDLENSSHIIFVRIEQIQQKEKEAKTQLEICFSELVQLLEKRKEKLLEDIRSTSLEKVTALTNQRESLAKTIAFIRVACEEGKQMLAKDDITMLKSVPEMKKHLKEARDKCSHCHTRPVAKPILDINLNREDIESCIASFGDIVEPETMAVTNEPTTGEASKDNNLQQPQQPNSSNMNQESWNWNQHISVNNLFPPPQPPQPLDPAYEISQSWTGQNVQDRHSYLSYPNANPTPAEYTIPFTQSQMPTNNANRPYHPRKGRNRGERRDKSTRKPYYNN